MQVTEATEATLEVLTVIRPSLSIVARSVADFLPPHVPFFRKSGFRELQLSGL